jgi:hypothetical protein
VIQATDNNLVHAFFNDRLGLHWSADFRGVVWVPDEHAQTLMHPDHVAIAVGYNAFIGRTCCMHTVIQRPDLLTRRIVRDAFAYPFNVANCNAVLALVDSTNAAALDLDTRLGFVEVARIPNGGPDADLVVMQMTRDQCRWLRLH